MPKRKRTREVTVKDVRTILRLSCAEGLSVREIADRLRIGKSSVSTYLYRAREAELAIWPLPEAYADDDVLKAALFEVDTTSYASVKSILETGLDRERRDHDIHLPLPAHRQIRGPGDYK